jgi:hypothetical protein
LEPILVDTPAWLTQLVVVAGVRIDTNLVGFQ